ncbi:TRAP transporter substrate-binding protein [Labrenzia sp. 011]|uniref:TRAP transporter substrate-binding protein n=1 Tax=Labrenzia sp. 011 TaxID=2171494 RepID=UPI000D511DC8|nr:TRAP transporter substrate-binding protein [Labrenzia sp. 011]PVB60480.1 C4-dicarboxylate transporter [Labrenzia sp. 011]
MKHIPFIAALVMSSAVALPAFAADVTVKIATVVSGDHPENVGAREIKRLVEERSNGEIEVRIFTDGQLGNQRELVEQLRNGTLEITWVTTGFFGSWEPVMNTLEIGYLFDDREHAFRAFDGELGEEVATLIEKHGVKHLGFYEAGMRHVTNSVRPINTPDDLKGLKLRTPNAKYHLTSVEMMGASPTPMAFSELYAAMEQKIVDGQENPLSNIHAAAFYEVNDHLALTGHLHLTHMVMYSEELWNKLSKEHQEIISQAVIDSQQVQRDKVAADDASLLAVLEEKGMQITRPDRAALAEKVAPLREQAIEEFGDQSGRWIELIDQAR